MRMSAILWLVPGLLCALVALGSCGGGGYWVYQSHTEVEKIQDDVTKETEKLEKLKKKVVNIGDDFKQDLHKAEVNQQNAERNRLIAAIVTATSLIPGLMALAFLGMAGVKFMQKEKKPPVEVEIEEDDDEESPPVKMKPPSKNKPADEE